MLRTKFNICITKQVKEATTLEYHRVICTHIRAFIHTHTLDAWAKKKTTISRSSKMSEKKRETNPNNNMNCHKHTEKSDRQRMREKHSKPTIFLFVFAVGIVFVFSSRTESLTYLCHICVWKLFSSLFVSGLFSPIDTYLRRGTKKTHTHDWNDFTIVKRRVKFKLKHFVVMMWWKNV